MSHRGTPNSTRRSFADTLNGTSDISGRYCVLATLTADSNSGPYTSKRAVISVLLNMEWDLTVLVPHTWSINNVEVVEVEMKAVIDEAYRKVVMHGDEMLIITAKS